MTVEFIPLGELLIEIGNGIDADQYDRPLHSGMVPISRIETISAGVIDFARVKYAAVTSAQRSKYQLRTGDILFSHINSPEHIGKTALFTSNRTLIHGINLLLLRPDVTRCLQAYLNYYLKSSAMRAHFRARCKKAVNQASLNQSDIVSVDVPLPTLAEQEGIVATLDWADQLRRLRRYALQLSETLLQAVFLEMFGDPATNPKGWPVERLAATFDQNPQIGTIRPASRGGSHLVIRVGEIGDLDVNLERCGMVTPGGDECQRFQALPGDFLLARAIGSEDHLGKASVLQKTAGCVLFDSHVMRLRFQPAVLDPIFFWHLMKTPGGRARFMTRAGRTAVQYNVNSEQIAEVELPLPPRDEQEGFLRYARRHRSLQRQQHEALRQAEHLFQTLLQRAFRGELRTILTG